MTKPQVDRLVKLAVMASEFTSSDQTFEVRLGSCTDMHVQVVTWGKEITNTYLPLSEEEMSFAQAEKFFTYKISWAFRHFSESVADMFMSPILEG